MIQFQDKNVALDAIDAPNAALRESIDEGQLGDLADDMAVTGLLQPIGLRGPSEAGRYEIIWGHRRALAAKMLGWPSIAARVCEPGIAPELARLAENFHRVDLNPREEARAIASLRNHGRAVAEIARILRRSVGWVQTRIELQTWPDDIQDGVASGALSLSSARLLAEIDHAEYRASLVAEQQRTGASTNVVSVWLAHYVNDRERIIRNHETVDQITSRRENYVVMFDCEVCGNREDTSKSVLLRICFSCARTLADERRAHESEQAPPSQRA